MRSVPYISQPGRAAGAGKRGEATMELHEKSCVPCKGGVPPLSPDEVSKLLALIEGWEAPRDHHLTKMFRFPDFKAALAFVDRVGAMAEQQGHHPDLHLAWGKVTVEVWTHKINGLTESDFVFAAKCDRLASSQAV
jgi:4a-hydroxytetrahydrobiopterin dehydratase